MNLIKYFEKGIEISTFEDKLGDNKRIHELHYKKFNPDTAEQSAIKNLLPMKIVVITEPWCGDSLASLPVLKKMGEINGKWEIKILHRDENIDLIDQFLTNGGRAIPIFLFLDDDGNLISKWGPRIETTRKIFENNREKIKNGIIEHSEVILMIRKFYSVDRGKEIFKELLNELKNV